MTELISCAENTILKGADSGELSMTSIETIKAKLATHKKGLEQRFGVDEIGIFGSFARGEQGDASDLDILVTFSKPIGLGFVELADYLEQLLGMKVHLVSKGALKPRMIQHVTADIVYV